MQGTRSIMEAERKQCNHDHEAVWYIEWIAMDKRATKSTHITLTRSDE